MSETETHNLRLKEVDLNGLTVEEFAKAKLQPDSATLPLYMDNWTEVLIDKFYNEYFIVDDRLYQATEKEILDNEDYVKVTKNYDGTISLMTSFYNGGASLSEIVEEELRKLHK